MLPKKNRLNKNLFDEAFKKGRVYHSDSISLKISNLEKKSDLKFAFVVPIKTIKKAVKRNELKRQGYNIINKYINNIEKGFVFIFIVKKEILKQTQENYEKEIVSLLKKSSSLSPTKKPA